MFECFVDYPAVALAKDPQGPGMVLEGRTGAGKTAILRYINQTEHLVREIDPFEMAMSYVANSDVLNFVQNIGGDLDLFFQVLWKHVLCIEFIRLRFSVSTESESRNIFSFLFEQFSRNERRKKPLNYLREWEGKFWITMDQNIREITEKVESKLEVELGAELAKAKARGQYERQLSNEKKSELVSRIRKVINADQLTDLAGVIDILHERDDHEHTKTSWVRTHYILIDKLDERWVDTTVRFKFIRALIESLRAFRRITRLKIVVALGTDIVERVVQENRDLSFQREKYNDYFIRVRWTKGLLKELTQKRIRTLFRRQYSPNAETCFEDLFAYKIGNVDPFDYIVDRTLMRPLT